MFQDIRVWSYSLDLNFSHDQHFMEDGAEILFQESCTEILEVTMRANEIGR